MFWTDDARAYYFKNDVGFDERYCSSDTRKFFLRQELDLFSSFRRVARQLTFLMPHAIHSTPSWNQLPPVIVVGRPDRLGRVRGKQRVGVCIHEGALYMWLDRRLNPPANHMRPGQGPSWAVWHVGATQAKTLWRYHLPIDLAEDDPGMGHPLHPEAPLGSLLTWIANAFHVEPPPLALQQHLDPFRNAEESHMPGQPIHPRLLRAWR